MRPALLVSDENAEVMQLSSLFVVNNVLVNNSIHLMHDI